MMFKTKTDNSSEWMMIPTNICRSCTLNCQRKEFQNKSRIFLSNSIYISGILNNQIPSFIHTYTAHEQLFIHLFSFILIWATNNHQKQKQNNAKISINGTSMTMANKIYNRLLDFRHRLRLKWKKNVVRRCFVIEVWVGQNVLKFVRVWSANQIQMQKFDSKNVREIRENNVYILW